MSVLPITINLITVEKQQNENTNHKCKTTDHKHCQAKKNIHLQFHDSFYGDNDN